MKKYFSPLWIRAAVCASVFILLKIFSGTAGSTDDSVVRGFYNAGIKGTPDTNIVLIHISSEDISQLGPYPLKRSYYALLINRLSGLDVRSVGLGIFLSGRLSYQNIYNSLLDNEIRRSGRVVLGSVIGESGAVDYPEPKKSIPGLPTGFLDYTGGNSVSVPLQIKTGNETERTFSAELLHRSGYRFSADASPVKLNFFNSWKMYRNYSLLEFFEMADSGNNLQSFSNKIVIVGVSDPVVTPGIATSFDASMPVFAIHAFAADNLLHSSYIKTDIYALSAWVFTLLIALTIFLQLRLPYNSIIRIISAPAAAVLLWIVSLAVFAGLYQQLAYAFFLFPLAFLFVCDIAEYLINSRKRYKEIRSMAENLSASLDEKRIQFARLQKELDAAGDDGLLIEKITRLRQEIEELRLKHSDEVPGDEPAGEAENFFGIVYRSRTMARMVSLIKRVAPEDVTVLILGESGTGKELVARAIHELNRRAANNFVAVNCAALSETLLESELFGHVKGAFTGAYADKSGRFETADNGTIFLDEIGETSENFQVRLLRVLQTGEFERVGSPETIRKNIRVIAATNKNLEQLVREKKFREDLYYRLNVIQIKLPPLRERKEDIEIIAQYFLSLEKHRMSFSKPVLGLLQEYQWRGNVRELQSVVKRAAILAHSEGRDIIKTGDLPAEVADRRKMEIEYIILDSLREKGFSHSSVAETAKELGELSRTIVSENFRGMVFRYFAENGYDTEKTIEAVSGGSSDPRVAEKVKTKVETFLNNIKTPVREIVSGTGSVTFEEVRSRLTSKYKNLPQRFHTYLDAIVKEFMDQT
ncbi:MAG: sigma 54-interacting transcriptional regulator [Bacteroidota bacterium]